MYKRIGSLYKPVFGKVDGGKKLRRKLRDELRRRAKSDKALQAFLRAF
jgi:hypothetical protein